MISILRGSFDIILPCVLDAAGRCKLPPQMSGDMEKLEKMLGCRVAGANLKDLLAGEDTFPSWHKFFWFQKAFQKVKQWRPIVECFELSWFRFDELELILRSGRQVRLLCLRSKRGAPSRLSSRKRSVFVYSRHLDMFCWIYATNCTGPAQQLGCKVDTEICWVCSRETSLRHIPRTIHGRFATKTARTKCNGFGKSNMLEDVWPYWTFF